MAHDADKLAKDAAKALEAQGFPKAKMVHKGMAAEFCDLLGDKWLLWVPYEGVSGVYVLEGPSGQTTSVPGKWPLNAVAQWVEETVS